MNALKHGLDAQTLILPGEDEAAFRARLDAWRSDVRPRNPLEDALVEQAARLSWQLDRADRVQAVFLAERIRLAVDDEARRPDREAAEAAAIGNRLILGGNRTGMPIHPDDPDHPGRLLGRLESTAAGCRWLLDRWGEVRAALEGDACWRPEVRLRAVRLLGRAPVVGGDDPPVLTIDLDCSVLDPDGPQVFADQSVEMTAVPFQFFLQRPAGRRVSDRVPPHRASARDALLAMVDGVTEELEALAAVHADRAEALAASASSRLAFDDSPDGERMQRLQVRLMNALLRTIDVLWKVRRDPDASGDRDRPMTPTAHEILASSPIAPADCEKMRNEPIVAEPAADPNGERVEKVDERSQPTRAGRREVGSELRIGESNPRGPSRRTTGRARTRQGRSSRVPISSVRPLSAPAHRRQRTPSARPPPP